MVDGCRWTNEAKRSLPIPDIIRIRIPKVSSSAQPRSCNAKCQMPWEATPCCNRCRIFGGPDLKQEFLVLQDFRFQQLPNCAGGVATCIWAAASAVLLFEAMSTLSKAVKRLGVVLAAQHPQGPPDSLR